MFKKISEKIHKIGHICRENHISAFASQVSFYFIMSLFPFAILVVSILNLMNVNISNFNVIYGKKLIEIQYSISNAPIISLSTVIAAWSSGKTFSALKECFQYMLNSSVSKGYFKVRFKGIIVSVVFCLIISMIIIIAMFGNSITDFLVSFFNIQLRQSKIIYLTRKIFTIISLFIIIFLTYRFLPQYEDKKHMPKIKKCAIFSGSVSTIIYVYTVFYSAYLSEYSNMSVIYNSMTTIVSVMLLVYSIMFAIILGFKLLIYKTNY